jgi:membrane protease YdiL (CAAX protease family)
MSAADRPALVEWRAAHGGVLLAALALPHLAPGLTRWPLPLLAPLLLYAAVVLLVGPLRRSVVWLRAGRCDAPSALAALGVLLLASAALLVYDALVRPDVSAQAAQMPRVADSLVLSAAVFAVVNAALEEMIFRGPLYDGLTARWGDATALVVTSAVFGFAHLGGYPPGWVGAGLAAVYGAMLGGLRWRTGGLAVPVFVHVWADVTVFVILRRAVE